MRKWIAAASALLVFALLLLFAWRIVSPGDQPAANDSAARTEDGSDPAAEIRSRERMRVRGPAAPDDEPNQPGDPPADADPITEVTETEASGVLLVTSGATDAPVAGAVVAFFEIDFESPPGWATNAGADADWNALAEQHGRLLRTGIDGRVRLPAFQPHSLTIVQTEHTRGAAWIRPEKAAEWRLRVWASHRVAVRVVDETRAPQERVPVAVVLRGGGHEWSIAEAVTDEDGTATLRISEGDLGGSQVAAGAGAWVSILLPHVDAQPTRVDPAALPEAPIELVLPPTGSLRVEIVDESGAPWREAVDVVVGSEEGSRSIWSSDPRELRQSVSNGVAEFPRVGTGGELRIRLEADDQGRATATALVTGPATPGSSTTCRVTIGSLLPHVVGRMQYEDGSPAANAEFVARTQIPGQDDTDFWLGETKLTTDHQGRFRLRLSLAPGDDEKVALHIAREVASQWGGTVTIDVAVKTLERLRSGRDNEIGVITIVRPLLVASGTVLAPDGRPIAGARVAAMESPSYGGRHPMDDPAPATTDAAGCFELKGTFEASSVELGVSASGYLLDEPVRCAKGATGVAIRMNVAGGIAGSLVMPEGMDPWEIEIQAEVSSPRTASAEYQFRNEGVDVEIDEGTFALDTLRAGVVSVSFRLQSDEDNVLLVVKNVIVAEGEITRDPRLQNVNLATLLTGFRVTIVDSDRNPIPLAAAHAREPGTEDFWTAFDVSADGVARVWMTKLPEEVLAAAPGYRTEIVRGFPADTTVVLKKAKPTRVTLRLAPNSPLPDPPKELQASLEYAGPLSSTGRGSDYGNNPRSGSDSVSFGKDRTVEIVLDDPGRFRVELMLRELGMSGSSGSGVQSKTGDIIVVVPGDGSPISVDIALGADAVR